MTQYLHTSLERPKTSYVDLFFIHKVSNVKDEINQETKAGVHEASTKKQAEESAEMLAKTLREVLGAR